MEDKKIAYLKNRLEQALQDDSAGDVNNCYQELKDLLDGTQLAEISQKVADYNSRRSKEISQSNTANEENVKQNIRSAKHTYQVHLHIEIAGLVGGFGALLLGFLFVMCGTGVLIDRFYNDFIMYSGVGIAILGGVMIFIGIIFAFIKSKSFLRFSECRKEVFDYVCENDSRLQKLVGIVKNGELSLYKTTGDNKGIGATGGGEIYIGGIAIKENPFKGVAAAPKMILERSGIGTLYTDDLLMKLEGEFNGGTLNGVVDIQWEDGNEWHGQYKNNLPWDGKGKAYLKNKKAVIGVWKNGMKIG
ncbi:hypothetical protein [Hominenteromicrobium sp.]|uniref:hypothetical protein n=1 Tax=Hominenteromicrobium sp. TaxID=3073581 RepID=UPI003A8D17EB